jgi:thymidylate synthase
MKTLFSKELPFKELRAAFMFELQELLEHGAIAPAISDPLSPASRFGERPRSSIELIGQAFQLSAGTPSIVVSDVRKPDLRYLLGQTVWFLAGSDDVEFLDFYNPKARSFSHDGTTLCGSFGKRLLGPTLASSQVAAAAALLKRDPGSRRAYLCVIDSDDLMRPTKETPCSCGIQFFVRDQRLHAVCSMRAQHALALLPNDAFLFLTLQAVLASELNLERGTYTHFCNTLHVYEDERDSVRKILASNITEIHMPIWKGGFSRIASLVSYEAEMRSAVLEGNEQRVYQLFNNRDRSEDDMCNLLKGAIYVIALKKMAVTSVDYRSVLAELRECGIEENFL